jgi:glycosyltransferase involved in cell wall biosynthesis
VRVLLLAHRYPPMGRGGVETWARELAAALAEAGHPAAVLTRDDRDPPERAPFTVAVERDGPVEVHRIAHRHGLGRTFRDAWLDRRFAAPLERLLDRFAPDVVHVGHPDGWGVLPFRLAAARGLVTGATLHDYKWICARGQMVRPPGLVCTRAEEERCVRCVGGQLGRGPLRAALAAAAPGPLLRRVGNREALGDVDERSDPGPQARARWRRRQAALLGALRDADVVTSPSLFVARRFAEAGLERPIAVISNGLRPRRTTGPAPQRASGPLRIGFFGSPLPTKGFDLLIRAFASLPAGSATLTLHGPAEGDLPPLPPGATASGPYDAEQAVEAMESVDVVALPSTWDENQPIVALEARLAGRPLLVADRGGLPELVRDGVDGWIVRQETAEAWGERLALLAASPTQTRAAAARVEPPATAEGMASRLLEAWTAASRSRLRPSGSTATDDGSPPAC